MSTPSKVIEERYGDVFVYFSKNVKINSEETQSNEGDLCSLWNTYLDVGTINPVILHVVASPSKTGSISRLRDLPWKSVHVRSYASHDEVLNSEVEISTNNPQKPKKNALYDVQDFKMQAVSSTNTSKTYYFEEQSYGKMTLHTHKPNIDIGGNDLPSKTTFLPSLQDSNWVYEK